MNDKHTIAGLRQKLIVVKLICEGKSRKEIAHEMGISDKTVDWHITDVKKQLGDEYCSIAKVIRWAIATDLFENTNPFPKASMGIPNDRICERESCKKPFKTFQFYRKYCCKKCGQVEAKRREMIKRKRKRNFIMEDSENSFSIPYETTNVVNLTNLKFT